MTLPDFDYTAKPQAKLEVPLAERIAEIRARKAQDRERAKINAARKEAAARRPAGPAGRGSGAGGQGGQGGAGGAGGGSSRRRGGRGPRGGGARG